MIPTVEQMLEDMRMTLDYLELLLAEWRWKKNYPSEHHQQLYKELEQFIERLRKQWSGTE